MATTLKYRIHLIANPKSGAGRGESLHEMVQRVCDENKLELVRYKTSETEDLDTIAEKAVKAAEIDKGVVVAAGGDGTIRTVAQKAHGRDVKFSVIPCGTFNFFARNHGIPDEHEEALKVAIFGEVKKVRLGEINGNIFLINASLGLYAKSIRDREIRTNRWGRNRLVAILSSILSFFQGHKKYLHVTLISEKAVTKTVTPMVFIGNNALQLRDLKMDVANCMKQDLLAVVLLKPIKWWALLRIIYYGIFKILEREDAIQSFCVNSLTIETRYPHKTVALDGELFSMTCPLEVKALPQSLNLMTPKVQKT